MSYRFIQPVVAALVALLAMASPADEHQHPLETAVYALDQSIHTKQIDTSRLSVRDYQIGLGPMQKFSGDWRFEKSERLSGELLRYSWQIIDGYTSVELMQRLLEDVQRLSGIRKLFSCDGRACGHGAQWANRVFGQRVLYGRADMQRYRVFAVEQEEDYRLLVYASARTADRQYLHVELLRISTDDGPGE